VASDRRRRRLRVALRAATSLTLAAVALTVVALEGGEVVVVRTLDPAGTLRTTRTWAAEAERAVWIEAANPERPFLRDLVERPQLQLVRGDRTYQCDASIVPNPEGHSRIRALLRERYGWRDAWVGLFTDTERSVAVRLLCR